MIRQNPEFYVLVPQLVQYKISFSLGKEGEQ